MRKPEREQRDAERDLPARDRAQAPRRRSRRGCPARAGDGPRATTATTIDDDPDGDQRRRPVGPPSPPVEPALPGTADAAGAPGAAAPAPAPAGATDALAPGDRAGPRRRAPDRAAPAADRTSRRLLRLDVRPARRRRRPSCRAPSAALNASSSVRPSAYERIELDERVLAVRPDDEVDRRRRSPRRRRKKSWPCRELAGQPVERDERARRRAADWTAPGPTSRSPRSGRPPGPR